jgi:hypothetical protein
MRRIGLWALAGLLLTACGDDEEKSPVQKCKDMVNTFCDRVTSCAVDADILDADYPAAELKMDCKEAIDTVGVVPCDEADGVGDNYSECVSDLKAFSCDTSNDSLLQEMPSFAPPPASCDDAILFAR